MPNKSLTLRIVCKFSGNRPNVSKVMIQMIEPFESVDVSLSVVKMEGE